MPDYLEFDVTLKGRFRVKLETGTTEVDKNRLAMEYEAKLDSGNFDEVTVDFVSRVTPV